MVTYNNRVICNGMAWLVHAEISLSSLSRFQLAVMDLSTKFMKIAGPEVSLGMVPYSIGLDFCLNKSISQQ